MPIEIQREIFAPAGTVLDAIRRAAEWRESAVSNDLKKGAVIGIESRVKGSRFRLGYVRKWYPEAGDLLELRGTVSPLPDGGSRVTAVCDYNRGRVPFLLILVALTLVAGFSGGTGVAALVGIALLVAASAFLTDRKLESGVDDEANYLVKLLERSLDALRTNDRGSAPAV